MNEETISFKEFFSSLSSISSFRYEIYNGLRHTLSSEEDRLRNIHADETQKLSSKIAAEKTFQHAVLDDAYTLYGVPLKEGSTVIGSLIAHGSPNNGRPDAHSMETFLFQLAEIIEDKWSSQKETDEMAEELAQSFEDLNLYSRIAAQIKTLKFSGNLLHDLMENIMESMRVDFAFAMLPERPDYNVLLENPVYSAKSIDFDKLAQDLIDLIPSVQPVLTDNYFIVNNSSTVSKYCDLYPKPYRFLAVRIEHHGEVYGWLGLTAFNSDEIFRQSELRLLSSMAEQIAMVIANTELYQDMERFIINVVRSLVYAIEAKDYYTKGHSERVNHYCMMIADKLEMEIEEKDYLHWASILHDVGKIGIPEVILNKPEFLDAEEYGLIKNHPQKGIEILRPIEQLAGSLPGVLHHHERWDGKGYPKGLKGEAIPLIARIIGIADTFDALTTDRAYRNANDFREALTIMEKASGSQLDARLFDIFKNILLMD